MQALPSSQSLIGQQNASERCVHFPPTQRSVVHCVSSAQSVFVSQQSVIAEFSHSFVVGLQRSAVQGSSSVHWPSAVKITQLNALIAYYVANDPLRPKWNRDDFFGTRFAPSR